MNSFRNIFRNLFLIVSGFFADLFGRLFQNRRRCGLPDRLSNIQINAYGSPGSRWKRGNLTYRVDSTNSGLTPNIVNSVIDGAFQQWQNAAPYFMFRRVTTNADIEISFGNSALYSRFGTPGGTVAFATYPEKGRLYFDSSEPWTGASLPLVALHEIGHVLGLSHSNDRRSLMYPFLDTMLNVLDAETISAIRGLYQWHPQIPTDGKGTSDEPSLAVAGYSNFTDAFFNLYMAWKGVPGDSGIYWSKLEGDSWSPQRKIESIGSSHSPALIGYSNTLSSVPTTGLFMAWKGISESGIYFSRNPDLSGWLPQEKVEGVGTSCKPALAEFNGRIHMAWKGIDNDQGIYHTTFDKSNWKPEPQSLPIRGFGTSDSPALVSFGNRLYMIWKGIEGDSNVYFSWIDSNPDPIWQAQQIVSYPDVRVDGTISINIGTSTSPAVTVRGNAIVIAWKGVPGDSGIWFAPFQNDELSGQINVSNVGTSNSPSLAVFNDRLYMAWKGIPGDNRIYFSWLG